MAKAKDGDTVRIHYTGRLDDGTVFDSSEGRDPLEFTLGEGQVIPGFENGVKGMEPGEKRTITIPADQAYGERRDDLVAELDRKELPEHIQPAVGQQLQIRPQEGGQLVVTVTEITDEKVTLDGNHPLAGKDLTFDIHLVAAEA